VNFVSICCLKRSLCLVKTTNRKPVIPTTQEAVTASLDKLNQRPYLRNKLKAKGLGCGSRGRALCEDLSSIPSFTTANMNVNASSQMMSYLVLKMSVYVLLNILQSPLY
jgi:hypothetical protein